MQFLFLDTKENKKGEGRRTKKLDSGIENVKGKNGVSAQ